MPTNLNTVLSTSTTVNISLTENTYIISATGASDYNYNLPLITCDGMKYIFVRIDNITTRNVNLNAFTGNTISPIANSSLTTVRIFIQRYIELVSSGSTWLVLDRKTEATGGGIKFSASFVNNNSIPKIVFPNGTNFLYFPFLGTSNGDMINEYIILYESSKTSAYTITLFKPGALTVSASSGTTVLNTITPIIRTLSDAEKLTLPTTTTYLYFNLNAANQDFGIYSVLIY